MLLWTIRTIARLAVAITVAMPIAPSAPLLFAFLHRLLARIGQPAFRAILMRLLLRLLLWPGRPLLLVSLATGAGTVSLRAARFLARPAIAATVAPAMTFPIPIGAAAAAMIPIPRPLLSRSLRAGRILRNICGCWRRRRWCSYCRLGGFRGEPTQDLAQESRGRRR